jgi:hypothetical protein
MKPRRVILEVEIDSTTPSDKLREIKAVMLYLNDEDCLRFSKEEGNLHQLSINVIKNRPKKASSSK